MPRKIRQLKADLRKAGFIELRERGKGSHSRWEHPDVSDVAVTVSGHDGADAKDYQESAVRRAVARVKRVPSLNKLEAHMAHKTVLLDVTEAESNAAQRYAIVIEWSAADDAFVVSVPDFPEIHTHGASREEAATMANEAIALTLAAARYAGRTVQPPTFSALYHVDPAGVVTAGRRSA